MGSGRSRGNRLTSRPWTSGSVSPAPSARTRPASPVPGRNAPTAASGSTTSPSRTAGPAEVSVPGPAAQTVRDIIDANRYLVLATADVTGRPWSSPLHFAHIDFVEFFWVSSPDVTHSRNVAVRPEVGIVVFNSQVAIGAGQGVYMSAVAELLEGGDTSGGIDAFSRRSQAHGGQAWTSEDVRPGADLRLYRGTADSHWI